MFCFCILRKNKFRPWGLKLKGCTLTAGAVGMSVPHSPLQKSVSFPLSKLHTLPSPAPVAGGHGVGVGQHGSDPVAWRTPASSASLCSNFSVLKTKNLIPHPLSYWPASSPHTTSEGTPCAHCSIPAVSVISLIRH